MGDTHHMRYSSNRTRRILPFESTKRTTNTMAKGDHATRAKRARTKKKLQREHQQPRHATKITAALAGDENNEKHVRYIGAFLERALLQSSCPRPISSSSLYPHSPSSEVVVAICSLASSSEVEAFVSAFSAAPGSRYDHAFTLRSLPPAKPVTCTPNTT